MLSKDKTPEGRDSSNGDPRTLARGGRGQGEGPVPVSAAEKIGYVSALELTAAAEERRGMGRENGVSLYLFPAAGLWGSHNPHNPIAKITILRR